MTRLPAIEDVQATDEVRGVFEGTKELLGFVSNSTRTMAHSPWVVRWWVPFITATNRDGLGKLDPSIRKLSAIKTSMLNTCAY